MAVRNPDLIKKIVRGNFDDSVSFYHDFETRYGLFEHLSRELAKRCNIGPNMRVLDVGCGTGASTLALADIVGTRGKVTGVDLSKDMLARAVKASEHVPNVDFKVGDAEMLEEAVDHSIDAVLYNASIFLLPRPEISLRSAYEVLGEGGIIGANHISGVYSGDGDKNVSKCNIFEEVKEGEMEFAPYGRPIFDTAQLPRHLAAAGFKNVRSGNTRKNIDRRELEGFYSIPAQSAGLYPRETYGERRKSLGSLFGYYESRGIIRFEQEWKWYSGVK